MGRSGESVKSKCTGKEDRAKATSVCVGESIWEAGNYREMLARLWLVGPEEKHKAIFSVNIRTRLIPSVSHLQASPHSLTLWNPSSGTGGSLGGLGKEGSGRLGGRDAR